MSLVPRGVGELCDSEAIVSSKGLVALLTGSVVPAELY